LINRVDKLKADTSQVPVTVNNPAKVVVDVLLLSVNVPAILAVLLTFIVPLFDAVSVAPLLMASEVKDRLLVPVIDTVPATKVVRPPPV
jgi:hypothetical protein